MSTTNASTEPLTGIQKAAILLVSLGDQVSAEILKELEEDEVQKVSQEVARLGSVSAEQAEAVLQEFFEMSVAHEYVLKGGVEYARKLLISAFGPETGRRMLERLMKALGNDFLSFDALQKADPQQLARFIHSEHPQMIALILSHLNPSQAAALLVSLPLEMRADVAYRMAKLDRISPEIISRVAAIIGQKLNALGEISRESYGGVRAVAEMLNRMDSAMSKDILAAMEQREAALTETVRQLMFVFEDMVLLDKNGIKEVLSRVDRKLLTVALKGTSEELKRHFTDCMSQRGAEILREDMEALGPVKLKDVEAAQQQIIALVRQLESEGVLSLKGTAGERYVV
ncbi:MAG TPA: flagellar motor switch protein FliG [Bryobacteraceae bacterium]|nr:flagellar motor switch protein FliG [Bryobacteraceae bacterium]HOQ46891.1 flagellar motor switch protein FliG [Bryobacteraceae bacterium]HPQ14349.1 flagellar motor switch protein FliG [Bryobacteraceae bacterium]HPU73016.1 flagellar motor switch protein FliG [Bryobacteraceae bacterium]